MSLPTTLVRYAELLQENVVAEFASLQRIPPIPAFESIKAKLAAFGLTVTVLGESSIEVTNHQQWQSLPPDAPRIAITVSDMQGLQLVCDSFLAGVEWKGYQVNA